MDIMGEKEKKLSEENFTNMSHFSFSSSRSSDDDSDDNRSNGSCSFTTNPLKTLSGNSSSGPCNFTYCRIKAEEVSPSGHKYSHRRATHERRNRINERERDRMHQLCDAFEKLRTVLPYKRSKRGPNRQKLSKIATLLLAQNYIRTLEDMLKRPSEYTNSTAASMMSQALAIVGVPAVNECYYTDEMSYNGMLEPSYGGYHAMAPHESDHPLQYYTHMPDYHEYNRVFSAEHVYPYL